MTTFQISGPGVDTDAQQQSAEAVAQQRAEEQAAIDRDLEVARSFADTGEPPAEDSTARDASVSDDAGELEPEGTDAPAEQPLDNVAADTKPDDNAWVKDAISAPLPQRTEQPVPTQKPVEQPKKQQAVKPEADPKPAEDAGPSLADEIEALLGDTSPELVAQVRELQQAKAEADTPQQTEQQTTKPDQADAANTAIAEARQQVAYEMALQQADSQVIAAVTELAKHDPTIASQYMQPKDRLGVIQDATRIYEHAQRHGRSVSEADAFKLALDHRHPNLEANATKTRERVANRRGSLSPVRTSGNRTPSKPQTSQEEFVSDVQIAGEFFDKR